MENLRDLREQLRGLDDTGRPWRANFYRICREEVTETGSALVSERLQQLWPCSRLRLAGSMVRRWKDNLAWRLSDDLQRRPGVQFDHAGKCCPRQHARRDLRRRQQCE